MSGQRHTHRTRQTLPALHAPTQHNVMRTSIKLLSLLSSFLSIFPSTVLSFFLVGLEITHQANKPGLCNRLPKKTGAAGEPGKAGNFLKVCFVKQKTMN